MERKATASKVVVLILYVFMITVNLLANIVPINGKYTGEILDVYPNLYTPATYTFGIWGLIYLLLFIFTIYQLDIRHSNKHYMKAETLSYVRTMFIITAVSNSIWIFAWHYDFIALSVMLIIIALVCMVIINNILGRETLSKQEKLFIRLPFSIYYGWITVATISNITVLLVSIRFSGFGMPEEIWMIIVLLISAVIITYRTLQNKDIIYCLTTIWAFIGIYVNQISEDGYAGEYPFVIYTLIGCIAYLSALSGFVYIQNRKHGI